MSWQLWMQECPMPLLLAGRLTSLLSLALWMCTLCMGHDWDNMPISYNSKAAAKTSTCIFQLGQRTSSNPHQLLPLHQLAGEPVHSHQPHAMSYSRDPHATVLMHYCVRLCMGAIAVANPARQQQSPQPTPGLLAEWC
jgi:hypothetical protein